MIPSIWWVQRRLYIWPSVTLKCQAQGSSCFKVLHFSKESSLGICHYWPQLGSHMCESNCTTKFRPWVTLKGQVQCQVKSNVMHKNNCYCYHWPLLRNHIGGAQPLHKIWSWVTLKGRAQDYTRSNRLIFYFKLSCGNYGRLGCHERSRYGVRLNLRNIKIVWGTLHAASANWDPTEKPPLIKSI